MADLIENTESQVEDNSILGIRDSEDKFRKKYEIKDVYTETKTDERRLVLGARNKKEVRVC